MICCPIRPSKSVLNLFCPYLEYPRVRQNQALPGWLKPLQSTVCVVCLAGHSFFVRYLHKKFTIHSVTMTNHNNNNIPVLAANCTNLHNAAASTHAHPTHLYKICIILTWHTTVPPRRQNHDQDKASVSMLHCHCAWFYVKYRAARHFDIFFFPEIYVAMWKNTRYKHCEIYVHTQSLSQFSSFWVQNKSPLLFHS